MNNLKIILHDEVQLLDWGESRAGGPWIKLRLKDPVDLEVFRGLDTAKANKTGHIFNATLAEGDITQLVEVEKPKSGQHIAELYKHGFFYNPKVLAALGPDEQYLEWVKNQPCAFDLGLGACDCDGDVVAAHVRRIASGSGTGIKPEYSAIPMCNKHHMEQHHYGESHFGGKEVFDTKAGEYKAKWAHMKLRKVFNVEHLRDVSLEDIRAWATEANVYHALPSMFIVQGEKGPYG